MDKPLIPFGSLAVRCRLGDPSSACWGATGGMAEVVYFVRCAYVVEATKNGRIEYWAVAAHRDDALTIVRTQTPPDWNLVLTERRLTHKQATELKMMHNTVLKLDEVASEIGYCAPTLKSNGAPANRVVSTSH